MKVTHYLLDPTSDDGRAECAYLKSYGFDIEDPYALELALTEHAVRANFIGVFASPWGLKSHSDGPLPAPNGRDAKLVTVWQMNAGSDGTARFVTTRPSRR